MSETGVTVTHDGIRKSLEAMVERSKHVSTFLQKHTLPQYQKAQMQRWITENSSEGEAWAPISSTYRTYKRKRYSSYEGSGDKLMIASGGLYRAATGRGDGMYKLITDDAFIVGIDLNATNPDGRRLDYAAYAAEKRPIMEFSDATLNLWKADIAAYITKGRP